MHGAAGAAQLAGGGMMGSEEAAAVNSLLMGWSYSLCSPPSFTIIPHLQCLVGQHALSGNALGHNALRYLVGIVYSGSLYLHRQTLSLCLLRDYDLQVFKGHCRSVVRYIWLCTAPKSP